MIGGRISGVPIAGVSPLVALEVTVPIEGGSASRDSASECLL